MIMIPPHDACFAGTHLVEDVAKLTTMSFGGLFISTGGQVRIQRSYRRRRVGVTSTVKYRVCGRDLIYAGPLTLWQVIMIPRTGGIVATGFGVREFHVVWAFFADRQVHRFNRSFCQDASSPSSSRFAVPKHTAERGRSGGPPRLVCVADDIYHCRHNHWNVCDNQTETVLDYGRNDNFYASISQDERGMDEGNDGGHNASREDERQFTTQSFVEEIPEQR